MNIIKSEVGLSDYTFKQAGYLRLKSLDIGYNLPKKALNTLHLSGLRIYFGGTNIFTVDKLKDYGYDPVARSTLDDNLQLGCTTIRSRQPIRLD